MDSKYSYFDKNGSNGSGSLNGKRKFSYGSMSGSPQVKKPNTQFVTKSPVTSTQTTSTASTHANGANKKVPNNDKPSQQLPILGVRDQ